MLADCYYIVPTFCVGTPFRVLLPSAPQRIIHCVSTEAVGTVMNPPSIVSSSKIQKAV